MTTLKYKLITVLFLAVLLPGIASAQLGAPQDIVETTPRWSQNAVIKGESVQLALEVQIADTWHINSHEPLEDFLIPTEATFQSPEGVTLGRIYYPEAKRYKFDFSENEVAVYEGTAHIITAISVDESFTGDSVKVNGTLKYQSCNNTSCLPPSEQSFTAALPVADNSSDVEETHAGVFSGMETGGEESGTAAAASESQISGWLSERGLLITLLLVFVGGLALNLTPCVYPLIPITVSYFGGQAKGDTVKNTFVLALFYVLGMAIMYSLLGTVAALTGQMIGTALQNPLVLGFIALILVALAASMFGAYEITVPQSLASIGGKSRQGIVGSLFMGLTVGIIAAPCIGPFVLSLLIFVGDVGNPYLGFLMFFVLSLGLGLPFLILGTFSGLLSKLPRSGQWMVWVRYIFGFILIGMAIYFLEPLFSAQMYKILLGIVAFAGAFFLGIITWRRSDSTPFKILKPAVGVLFLAVGLWIVIPAGASESSPSVNWEPYSAEKISQAASANMPVIIDFYADWCIPCKELDKFTFSDPAVISQSKQFTTLKADLTQNNDPAVQRLKEEYSIRGVPTIVFLDENGEEITQLRLTGYEPPEKFLRRMDKALSSAESLTKNVSEGEEAS